MTFTSRRQFLAATGTGVVAVSAGCLERSGDVLSSSAATISPDVLSTTGYAERTVEELVIQETVGRFGFERTIEARNWYAEYDRAVALDDLGLTRAQAAVVVVLTTPQVSLLGRTFNPVGDYDTDDLVELIQDHYGDVRDVSRVDETSVTVLGSSTPLVRYHARATFLEQGLSMPVTLQLTEPVAHGDDFVIGVAVYPRPLGIETESETVLRMIEGVEH
ncbi:DUF6517 family protein [Natronosalvus vescus]|uniref:DUF6517 family protein n=1 Tax=Natronosalvus vescus TaxID=2953881 RepID=UPI00209025B9|nr:DUF6517 family protein [Natronosalvus vescus]